MSNALDPIRWDVIDEHLDEADFLFEQWVAALESATYRHPRLCRGLEYRLVAHVDGLAVGGDAVAERLLWPAIAPDADGVTRVAAATAALVSDGDPARIDRLLAAVGTLAPGPCRDGVVLALTASPRPELSARVWSAAERVEDQARAPLLAIAAGRGGSAPGPRCTAWMDRAATLGDPGERAIAAAAAVHLPRANALRVAERLLGDADARVQAAAFATGLVHGSAVAYGFAVDVARGRLPAPVALVRVAMTAVALIGESGCVEMLHGRAAQADLRDAAIWALGFTGRIDAVSLLLPMLVDDAVAALAAEAIVGITGLGRDEDRFWKSAPPESPTTLEELAADLPPEDTQPEPAAAAESELPLPVAEVFERAWHELRPKVDARQRFAEGRPLVHSSIYVDCLGVTTMRRRSMIAWELAIRSRGALFVPTRSFGALQRPLLAAAANAGPIDGARPFARIS